MDKKLTIENIIDQDVLRQVEALCTQEEPPACTAACPLHLDVRAFLGFVEKQEWSAAWKLYAKSIPLPTLVARTCNAPCKGPCRRAGQGGAIEVRLVEQAVAQKLGAPAPPPLMLPKKTQKAAIVGGGVRGMAAAADLARKGYQVTLFEATDRLGGALWAQFAGADIEECLRREIEALGKLKVKIVYGERVACETEQEIQALLGRGFDGAYLACESPLAALAHPATQLTPIEMLVAGNRGGRLGQSEAYSTVYDAFDGRSAATSLDRLFQQVSVAAGREKEGSADTSLFTSLEGVAPRPPEITPESLAEVEATAIAQATAEAGRCLQCQCLECVKKCAFLQTYKSHPRRYVREVYNNLSIAMGTHHANDMINTCAACGQCEAVCPNGLDMAAVFLAARRRMVHTGKMPVSAHEFALQDMAYSLSPESFLARHQPGQTKSRYLFFPGCQLAASEPALVEAAYTDLCARLEGGVGLMLGCCGVMAKWAGDDARLAAVNRQLTAAWEELGQPEVITGCPTCTAHLSKAYGMPARGIWEVLDEIGLAGAPAPPAGAMALHHACGVRHDTAVRQSIARLAGRAGAALDENAPPEGQSPCCGYGGLLPFVNSEIAAGMTEGALAQYGGGDTPLLTYCVNCRDRFLAKDRQAYHILELCYPGAEGLRRTPPTWSLRQQNRSDLKRGLQSALWGETTEQEDRMDLLLTPELEQKIQETHILHSDIQNAITAAEAGGEKLAQPESGHSIACYRPGNVTFWVEYAPEGDAFRVFNAYCHRMDAKITGFTGREGG